MLTFSAKPGTIEEVRTTIEKMAGQGSALRQVQPDRTQRVYSAFSPPRREGRDDRTVPALSGQAYKAQSRP